MGQPGGSTIDSSGNLHYINKMNNMVVVLDPKGSSFSSGEVQEQRAVCLRDRLTSISVMMAQCLCLSNRATGSRGSAFLTDTRLD